MSHILALCNGSFYLAIQVERAGRQGVKGALWLQSDDMLTMEQEIAVRVPVSVSVRVCRLEADATVLANLAGQRSPRCSCVPSLCAGLQL